ncbi:hypothetical protein UMZ34_12365 [Halopseudomonas pachastrellae]|nr:hypothetical protein UMZ34_12365 [Halopseudomonas pachastrellae]
MNVNKPVMIAALTMAALFTTAAHATSPTPPQPTAEPGYEQQAASAAQLLHKAVAAYREEGNAAFARFSRQGSLSMAISTFMSSMKTATCLPAEGRLPH